MLKNFFKFGKKKKGEEEQKSKLENQLDKEIQESEKGEVLKRAKILGYPSNIVLDGNLNIVKTLPGHLTAAQIKGAVK